MVYVNIPTGSDGMKLFILCSMLLFCSTGQAALTTDQQQRNNKDNYYSVEFNAAPLTEILFFVAEMTGQPFVLTVNDVNLSWVQQDIYKDDLVSAFLNVVISSGLSALKSGTEGQVIVISRDTTPADQPKSIQRLDGGMKVYLSEIHDLTGRYIVFQGIIYKKEDFPFPVIESPLGLMSIVPTDVYLAEQQYKAQLAAASPANFNTIPDTNEPTDQP